MDATEFSRLNQFNTPLQRQAQGLIHELTTEVIRYDAVFLVSVDQRRIRIRSSEFRRSNETRSSSMILYFTGMGNEGGFAEVLYFFHCIDPNETKDEDDNSDHVNDSSDESTRGNKGRRMGSYTTPQSHLLAMVRCINAEQSRGFFNRKPGKASTGKKIVINASTILDMIGFIADRGLETMVCRESAFIS